MQFLHENINLTDGRKNDILVTKRSRPLVEKGE